MFTIKVCGITTPDDALAAVDAGVDAIGLNFYPPSSRFVDLETARTIVDAVTNDRVAGLGGGRPVCKVGLFVNASVDEIVRAADALDLDLIQLHGDEPPESLRPLLPRPVLKAFRLGPNGLAPVRSWLDDCVRLSILPQRVLLDAYRPGQYGGTGAVADWRLAAAYAATPGVPPLVLAGGLTPENVAAAIQAVGPAAVDTAGGVETSPGRKGSARMAEFVRAARAAFEQRIS